MFPVTSSSSTLRPLRPDANEALSCFTISDLDSLLTASDNLTQSLSSNAVVDWGRSENKAIDDFHVELEVTSAAILAGDANNKKRSRNRNTGEQSELTATFSPARPDTEHNQYDICSGSGKSCLLEQYEVKSSDERWFRCGQCSRAFKTNHELTRHKIIHSDERPFVCKQCDRGFRRSHDLVIHEVTHSDARPFACKQCGKAFKRQGDLVNHNGIHDGKRPFSCKQCDWAFRRKCDLLSHEKIHGDERLFSCDQCNKVFLRKGGLEQHKKTHSSERPFPCDQCGKTFRRKDHLMGHLRVHNNGPVKSVKYNISEDGILARHNKTGTHQYLHKSNQGKIFTNTKNANHVDKTQDQEAYKEMPILLDGLPNPISVMPDPGLRKDYDALFPGEKMSDDDTCLITQLYSAANCPAINDIHVNTSRDQEEYGATIKESDFECLQNIHHFRQWLESSLPDDDFSNFPCYQDTCPPVCLDL